MPDTGQERPAGDGHPRLLIVRLGSLGDVIHAVPAAAALRTHFPEARLDWLVDPRYVELLDLVEGLDRPVPIDPRDLRLRGGAGVTVVRALRAARYDAVIDLQGLLKSAVLARFAGGARTIGFPRAHLREPVARLWYTEAPDPGPGPHVIDRNLGLLGALGVNDRTVRFPLRTPRTDVVASVAARFAPGGYALLNPGAAWPNKRWPPERFGRVAASIHRQHGWRSLVLWGPGEERLAAAVAEAAAGTAEVAPPTTITDLVGIARGARLMVSGDTGPLHIAGAVATPIVAIFGPTAATRNGPWAARDEVLSRFDRCRCHYERRCRLASPCIDAIEVDEVVGAVQRRLRTDG